jgi:hypothetical protein
MPDQTKDREGVGSYAPINLLNSTYSNPAPCASRGDEVQGKIGKKKREKEKNFSFHEKPLRGIWLKGVQIK